MSIKNQLSKLANESNYPCITIAFNTHRTAPDNQQDYIKLKNFAREAEDRLLQEFGKREIQSILDQLQNLPEEMDVSKNLESLHIYLSKDTFEFIRTTWPVANEGVFIDDSFAIRPLIKAMNRNEEYFILYLTQKGVHLYLAINDAIVREIENEDFPYTESRYNLTHLIHQGDESQTNKVKEFYNQVDKAVQRATADTDLPCLIIATDDNYNIFHSVADQPQMYIGNISADFGSVNQKNQISTAAWEYMKNRQFENRTESIEEMKKAINQGNVLTDLQEIYQAAIDGRGDLLIVHQDFQQTVRMLDDRTFDLIDDATEVGAIDDITSNIAWEIISKKGRAIFTQQDEIKELGPIVLKTRY